MFFSLASLLLTVVSANAHMIMSTPAPYSQDSLNNSPLQADGSDFPCKIRPNMWQPPTKPNNFPAGSTQPLSFIGSATHGGGSCQISLTTDEHPTKNSKWMVIKSFEGGCPADTNGNLGGGQKAADPFHFNFTIPTDIPTGKYTLSWTWFNRVGDREMYMNCAPINVSGGGSGKKRDELLGHRDFFKRDNSKYPPMFVANINGCTTKESKAIRFPNPGPNVQLSQENELQSQGEEACSGQPKFGGDAIKPGAGGSSPTSTSAPEPASTSSSASGGDSNEKSSSPAPSDSSSSSSPSSPSSGGSGSCSPEGDWNCVGGSSFQRCSNGKWTNAEPLAAGTSCKVGQTKNLNVVAPSPSASAGGSGSMKSRSFDSVRRNNRRHAVHFGHMHAVHHLA